MNNARYVGSITLPGDQESQSLTVSFHTAEEEVRIQFPEQESCTEWQGENVLIIERLKFYEVTFSTQGIPVSGVELAWRIHSDKNDGTAAGVITVKPNDKRISGDKGFILIKES